MRTGCSVDMHSIFLNMTGPSFTQVLKSVKEPAYGLILIFWMELSLGNIVIFVMVVTSKPGLLSVIT